MNILLSTMIGELEKARNETRDAFKNRAVLYRLFFEELSNERGEEEAERIMKRAIYRWGGRKSEKFKKLAETRDFQGVADEFMKSAVCGGELFQQSIHKCDEKSAVIDMKGCPLVDSWKEMGLSSAERKQMCEIANATDYGKFEGMGFKLTIESTLARGDDCCRLRIE